MVILPANSAYFQEHRISQNVSQHIIVPHENFLHRETFCRKENGLTLINPAFSKFTDHEILSFYFSFPASTTFPFEHRLGRVALAYCSMHFSMSLPSLKCLKCFLCPEVISQCPYAYILCINVSIQVPR